MLGGLLLGPIGVLVLKLLIDRSRPRATDFSLVTSVLDTFGSHSVIAGPLRSNDLHSFPSGHSATAAALATVLIWKYPQGRLFFIVVATTLLVSNELPAWLITQVTCVLGQPAVFSELLLFSAQIPLVVPHEEFPLAF